MIGIPCPQIHHIMAAEYTQINSIHYRFANEPLWWEKRAPRKRCKKSLWAKRNCVEQFIKILALKEKRVVATTLIINLVNISHRKQSSGEIFRSFKKSVNTAYYLSILALLLSLVSGCLQLWL